MNIERMLDAMPLDFPEATVGLIDALHDYIRCCDNLKADWVCEDDDRVSDHMQTCKLLLTELEGWQVDMNLSGLIKRRGV
jgi:hypothetical protein